MYNTNENTDSQYLKEMIANLKPKQKQILAAMLEYSLRIDSEIWILSEPPQKLLENINSWTITRAFNILEDFQERGWVKCTKQENNEYSLTDLGKNIVTQLKKHDNDHNKEKKRDTQKNKKLEKSYKFFELYKEGLSYQEIGDKYGISRERVRQVISIHPEFESYKLKQEEKQLAAEKLKEEQAKQYLYQRSIGVLYPERLAELWDYEKNGELKPEDILAGSKTEIYLKCPLDGHSWKKKTADIVSIWKHNQTSGCPACAGKIKKPQKQLSIIEAYPDFMQNYWDYEKNNELNLDPYQLTCGSNKKAWFKCPIDGDEWQRQISSTVQQQWSQGNPGCCVCNKTKNRKKGIWRRRQPIAIEFPDEIKVYWYYEKNDELRLDPMKLTAQSSKKAFFKCPIDGHEWETTINSIAGTSWNKGNSGCPACRGLVATETTCLSSLYPNFTEQYWNYEKNNQLGLYPETLTRGSQKEVWFKCPIDGYEWKTRIGVITKDSWKRGNSGCPACHGRIRTKIPKDYNM